MGTSVITVAFILGISIHPGTDGDQDRPGRKPPKSPGKRVDTIAELTFKVDPGIRAEQASVPMARVDPKTGKVTLWYNLGPKKYLVTSDDGLTFSGVEVLSMNPRSNPEKKRPAGKVQFPDGTFVRYRLDQKGNLDGSTSRNGRFFRRDSSIGYSGNPGDNGKTGVWDIYYSKKAGGVVLFYIGDMQRGGVNNVRRAFSRDGKTFNFEDDNVFADKSAGGNATFVDPKSIELPDGTRRMFTMWQGAPPHPGHRAVGEIYSFLSKDGKTYEREPGIRLRCADFSEFSVWSLNDPYVVRLLDGRYRMYICALVTDPKTNKERPVIVSATTPKG
ncbi:MAG: hypothetical protein CL877_09535 [Dehalococcoidales bacterium]|nr:hypothetical protein [Dehalococcoidales bacterium]